MKIFTLDPVLDPRWQRFVERHPHASIFHTPGWLESLRRTYGYEPIVYTTALESQELENGVAFCRIRSRLTGQRLVSLPFSDHCEPLVDTADGGHSLVDAVIDIATSQHYKYVEIRPVRAGELAHGHRDGMAKYRSFNLHSADISQDTGSVYSKFHRKAVQQPIKRAERDGVSVEEGHSPGLVRQFYGLLIRTRRRHAVPPQPFKWFQNLVDCLGERITFRVASHHGEPIASILTLSFNRLAYYKYGCTDERFHNLGGLQLLLWRAISAEKERGARILDMGRTDVDNAGLSSFKERWGCTRAPLTYYRYPQSDHGLSIPKWVEQALSYAFARMPDSVLTRVGGLLYPHMG